MIDTSPDIKDIAAALLRFQATATGVVKDSRNPAFKSRYASLEAVIDEVRPQLQSVGIAWMQAPGRICSGAIGMTTMLMHPASGQWMQSTMEIPLGKQDPQGAGSAITYAQRYALMATLGLPPLDDDAEAAMPRNHQSEPVVGRKAAAPSGQHPAQGGAAAPSAIRDRLIARIKQFDLVSEMLAWANSDLVHSAYNGLPEAERRAVDEAYAAQEKAIEATPFKEAAE